MATFSRYIEVFESDYEDMERNLQKGGVNRLYYGGTEAPIVKLRGLPFSVTEEQVKEFFSGLKVVSLKVGKFFYGLSKLVIARL